jgi:hypothetical protein
MTEQNEIFDEFVLWKRILAMPFLCIMRATGCCHVELNAREHRICHQIIDAKMDCHARARVYRAEKALGLGATKRRWRDERLEEG